MRAAAAGCAAAGAADGRSSCTTITAYRNGALVTPDAPDFVGTGNGGYGPANAGLNPVVKGLVGGDFAPFATGRGGGFYIGKSDFPQPGSDGDVADFTFFQDVALTAQNVSDLYSGMLRMC